MIPEFGYGIDVSSLLSRNASTHDKGIRTQLRQQYLEQEQMAQENNWGQEGCTEF